MRHLIRAVVYMTIILAIAVLASGGLPGGSAWADPKPPKSPPAVPAQPPPPGPPHDRGPPWWGRGAPPWAPGPPAYPPPPFYVTNADADEAVVIAGASVPIGCEVKDARGGPVSGAVCLFTVASQPGADASVSQQSAVTDASGRATTTLQTGSTAGSVTVAVEAQGVSSQVEVSVQQSPMAQYETVMRTMRAFCQFMGRLFGP